MCSTTKSLTQLQKQSFSHKWLSHHQVSHTVAKTISLSLSLSLSGAWPLRSSRHYLCLLHLFFFFFLQTFSSFLFLPHTATIVCLKVKFLYYIQTRQERVTQFVIAIVSTVGPSICEASMPWAPHPWLCSALSMPLAKTSWPTTHCF